ncbi:hypothetical protein DICVIV_01409 [Dictyocaulus viviparus]|uniref:Thrombospondin type 1 domain protein n=1 Tax=Dictyocaulus viviparus TaxID=29172 RepID=A0A0D8Y8A5_DICVI|nr:hypothetical protein DICVIV_01409 [Dictyocaulus viviparus]
MFPQSKKLISYTNEVDGLDDENDVGERRRRSVNKPFTGDRRYLLLTLFVRWGLKNESFVWRKYSDIMNVDECDNVNVGSSSRQLPDIAKYPRTSWIPKKIGISQETVEPSWAPTGKLSQFRGYVTPRPFPSNAHLVYASVWAGWSAWSFCSNGVQVRVRACNTVRGFSCLGPNQEVLPCDGPLSPSNAIPAMPSDYDVVDPYEADRREAMRQLYPDDFPLDTQLNTASNEVLPCDGPLSPSNAIPAMPSDYDVVDPYEADRREAMRQLYPDDFPLDTQLNTASNAKDVGYSRQWRKFVVDNSCGMPTNTPSSLIAKLNA